MGSGSTEYQLKGEVYHELQRTIAADRFGLQSKRPALARYRARDGGMGN
jgi:hypothetical protein